MKKLLGSEVSGNRTHTYYKHYGDDGREKLTVETKEDVTPVIQDVKRIAQSHQQGSDFKLKAIIPPTMVDDLCKISSKSWGCTVKQAFEEIVAGKTDRAVKAMRTLTDGRDFRKLQAKNY